MAFFCSLKHGKCVRFSKEKDSNERNIMEQANGKLKEATDKPMVKNLIGFKRKNAFGAKTHDELTAKMSEMGLVDLQRLAIQAGISARGTAKSLNQKISKAFDDYEKECRAYDKVNEQAGANVDRFSKAQREQVLECLK